MKLKDYSLQIKKNIAVLLHAVFLTLAVTGITTLYLSSTIGNGIDWLFDSNYNDSPAFRQQVQQDMDHVFRYVQYRDVFETDGALDLSKEMFSFTRNDVEYVYTLEEVIRYAQGQGFYLNEQFEVVNDLFVYDTSSTAKDCLVNWRSYDIGRTISEPGDAYASLLDLAREVLSALSEYYKVYHQFIANPSNFYFKILYRNDHDDQIVYSNAYDMTLEQMKQLGRYCFLSSDSILVDTNLNEIPRNITVEMEQNNFYDASDYYMMVAIDTSYPYDDPYAAANNDYLDLHQRSFEAFLRMCAGIIGCLLTLYYLVIVSGYQTKDSTSLRLHGMDMISTESCIVLTALLTSFSLFLGEKIGYKLIHLLVFETEWAFVERMMRAVIIYLCCLFGAFSLLRRYKTRQLWENSTIHQLLRNITAYINNKTHSYRLFVFYIAFIAIQIFGVGIFAILYGHRNLTSAVGACILLVLGLVGIDYYIFHRLFTLSLQQDKIVDTVSRIAGGDTSYQMDFSGFTGKELELARMLNSIGTGLEQALQDQVKSERLKADLITNVSHDIKTPLTSIINYIDLIKRQNIEDSRIQEYLNVLEQKSQRLKTLTEDLVEASKASSGNIKLEITELDLVEMIWQTNGEFEDKYTARHLSLISALPEEPIIIEADGRHLWRVLENLYNNAAKYAMENSRVYVDIEKDDTKAYVIIKNVSENPLNIEGEDLTERFVRGDVSRTTEGSGLGLSIAKSLTTLQGGSFQILTDADLFKVKIGFTMKKPPEEA
ncbi:MAG: sensor histidine kinase [Lachnospiraceae bacterium]